MSKSRSGCRGCLIWMACIFAGFVLIAGIAGYLGYRQLVALRDTYTQTKPLQLPRVSYTADELDLIHERIDQFMADAEKGNTNAHLSLSENEINSLLWSSGYSNTVYVMITNDSVRGLVSIPIGSLGGLFNKLGITFLKGRYLNGEVSLKVATANEQLSVTVDELLVNGQPLPEHYMKQFRQTNLAENLTTNASTKTSWQRIRQIDVRGDRLVLDVAPK